jgi:hypothetical protein
MRAVNMKRASLTNKPEIMMELMEDLMQKQLYNL